MGFAVDGETKRSEGGRITMSTASSTKNPVFGLARLAMATLAMVIFASFASAETAPAAGSVLGFQAWKTTRIDDAKAALEKLQLDKSGSPAGKGQEKKADAKADSVSPRLQKSQRPDQKLQQAQLNLEVAQELTVNDYFVLYLSQFKQHDAFVEAAKKLSPDEVADLMVSYQKRLSGTDDLDTMSSTSSTLGSTTISHQ